eukprot:16450437-Heterocapsa_arctica.AAC.1
MPAEEDGGCFDVQQPPSCRALGPLPAVPSGLGLRLRVGDPRPAARNGAAGRGALGWAQYAQLPLWANPSSSSSS